MHVHLYVQCTGKSLSEALLFAEHGENFDVRKFTKFIAKYEPVFIGPNSYYMLNQL